MHGFLNTFLYAVKAVRNGFLSFFFFFMRTEPQFTWGFLRCKVGVGNSYWGNDAAIFTPRVWLSFFHNKVREVFRVLLISYALRVSLLLSVPFTHTDKPR